MSNPPRQSMIRQTRSKTRAAKESANPNLQVETDSLEKNHSSNSFEPSIIDVDGSDKIECGGCDKPNSYELYMVQCRGCARWYHFSCANVKQSTVRKEAFVCKLCVPPASSRTSRTTTSSMRQARIARELECLEEERKLMERMHEEEFALQEKARKDKFEREKQYLAKRFDLLRQQDEQDGTSNSGSSHRCQHSRQGSQNRVQDWVDDVARITEGAGERLPGTTVVVNEKDFDPNVIITNEGHASSTPVKTLVPTPLVPLRLNDKSQELVSAPRTTGSPLDDLLNNPVVTKSKTGTIPKLQTRPSFEQWRSRTTNNEHEKERVKENDVRRQRELDLIDQLNRLEMQKEDEFLKNRELEQQMKTREQEQEQLVLQKQRELSKLEQQLQRQKQEQENFVQQQQKVLKKRDEELDRLRRLEQEYRQYRQGQKHRELHQAPTIESRIHQKENDDITTLRPQALHSAAAISNSAGHGEPAGIPRQDDIWYISGYQHQSLPAYGNISIHSSGNPYSNSERNLNFKCSITDFIHISGEYLDLA
nr:PH domain-containing protein DDB_G0287875-like [Aedes albopictus]